MNTKRYHIISRKGKWALKREGAMRPLKIYSSKAAALKASVKYQKEKFDVVVHDAAGTVSAWRKAK